MKERPIVVLDRIQTAVVLDRIQTAVVLDRIRMAVVAKWIQREREASDEDGKNGLHRIADSLRIGRRPMLFFP
jgi:hypothetical protein